MIRSVLVVDDDATFRRLATTMLEGWGYRVIGEAGTAEEGLARARELRPDAALVDIGLPDDDGHSLAHQLRGLPWPPRIVLISSDERATSEPAIRRSGANGFLAKHELTGGALRALIEDE